MYIPINAAIKIKITDQWHYIQLLAIIDTYQQCILFSIFHFIGYLEDKSSIASPMLTYMFTITKTLLTQFAPSKRKKSRLPCHSGRMNIFLV